MNEATVDRLRAHGIQASAQRVAVADYVLFTDEHPSAEQVYQRVRGSLPVLSKATVYNTLNLLVRTGLLRELALAEGHVVFDPRVEPHHHFVDDRTGEVRDLPWDAVDVGRVAPIPGYRIRELQVVLRGTRDAG
ncbi:MAG: transcriptional repressor [Polyangiaceae bacterium]|nr:transcriptional repressor [Polyangiaceae bacterium]